MLRIPYDTLHSELRRILIKTGFAPERADLCARLFADTTRDGVYSHGINRFPGFIRYIQTGIIDIHAIPEKVAAFGILEQWDGRSGPGNLNAHASMGRAIDLAREHGIGCVALKNTNHWMRAGAYGLQAADAGCVGMCWTNTTPLMPPWGSAERKIGNNPLVFSIPRPEGHILLDMAMSQFSNGKLEIYRRNNRRLPVPGGYDSDGALTCEPAAIEKTRRPLPIGHWKGSGLALVLDLLAALLTGGRSTYRIGQEKNEHAVSQVFIAIDVTTIAGEELLRQTVEEILTDFLSAAPLNPDERVRYPGEGMLNTRRENLEHGIPVDPDYWQQVLDLT